MPALNTTVCAFIFSLFACATLAQDEPVSTPKDVNFICSISSSSLMFQIMEIAFGHFFESQGHNFHLASVPEKRVTQILNEARVDGICGISNLKLQELSHNQYLLAASPHGTLDVVVAATHELSEITSMEAFVARLSSDTNLGIVGGSFADDLVSEHHLHYTNVVTIDRGVRMLVANRIDYLISSKVLTQHMVAAIRSDSLVHYSDTLYKLRLYNLLHKRHAPLRPKLDHFILNLTLCLKGDEQDVKSSQWAPLVTQPNHPCLQSASKTIN